MSAKLLQFPTSHARVAARRTSTTDAQVDEVAARIEEICAEINRIIDAENRELDRLLKDWKI